MKLGSDISHNPPGFNLEANFFNKMWRGPAPHAPSRKTGKNQIGSLMPMLSRCSKMQFNAVLHSGL